MKLYGYYRSSTSYRIRIALGLKGVAFDQVSVDLKNGAHLGPAFAARNPHRSVPLLETDNRQLTQSLAIIDWLEVSHPTPSFLPAEANSIQLCLELYYAIATEIHAPNNLAVLNHLKQKFGASDNDLEEWNQLWMHRTFEPVERRLATHDFATSGFPFGAAGLLEIVLIPQLYNARRWNVDLAPFPTLLAIEEHCETLEAFIGAHPDTQPNAPEMT